MLKKWKKPRESERHETHSGKRGPLLNARVPILEAAERDEKGTTTKEDLGMTSRILKRGDNRSLADKRSATKRKRKTYGCRSATQHKVKATPLS